MLKLHCVNGPHIATAALASPQPTTPTMPTCINQTQADVCTAPRLQGRAGRGTERPHRTTQYIPGPALPLPDGVSPPSVNRASIRGLPCKGSTDPSIEPATTQGQQGDSRHTVPVHAGQNECLCGMPTLQQPIWQAQHQMWVVHRLVLDSCADDVALCISLNHPSKAVSTPQLHLSTACKRQNEPWSGQHEMKLARNMAARDAMKPTCSTYFKLHL